MITKILLNTFLITALIYGSGLDQARSESVKDQVQRVDDQVKIIEKTLMALKKQKDLESSNNELPVGTIITSILNPSQFIGQLEDSEKHKWKLADGSQVKNSKFAKVIGSRVPDLRGMFLRGMNEDGKGADPDTNRKAGELQQDALRKHGHKATVTGRPTGYKEGAATIGYTRNTAASNAPIETMSVIVSEVTGANSENETRPKNVSVYFYIKIN